MGSTAETDEHAGDDEHGEGEQPETMTIGGEAEAKSKHPKDQQNDNGSRNELHGGDDIRRRLADKSPQRVFAGDLRPVRFGTMGGKPPLGQMRGTGPACGRMAWTWAGCGESWSWIPLGLNSWRPEVRGTARAVEERPSAARMSLGIANVGRSGVV